MTGERGRTGGAVRCAPGEDSWRRVVWRVRGVRGEGVRVGGEKGD